jgi:hypothetical protein
LFILYPRERERTWLIYSLSSLPISSISIEKRKEIDVYNTFINKFFISSSEEQSVFVV